MATRRRGCVVGRTSVSAQKGHNFLSDRCSRLKFYRGFERLFPWVRYGMATWWRGCLVGRTWVSAQKGHNFLSDRWIALKFLQEFPEAVFFGVAMEYLLGDGYILSASIEYRLRGAITFDSTVDRTQIFTGVSRGCFPWVSYWIAVQWRGHLVGNHEYRLKRAITFDPTVWSRWNFYRGFERLFFFFLIKCKNIIDQKGVGDQQYREKGTKSLDQIKARQAYWTKRKGNRLPCTNISLEAEGTGSLEQASTP
jgi:hypothetical protein